MTLRAGLAGTPSTVYLIDHQRFLKILSYIRLAHSCELFGYRKSLHPSPKSPCFDAAHHHWSFLDANSLHPHDQVACARTMVTEPATRTLIRDISILATLVN